MVDSRRPRVGYARLVLRTPQGVRRRGGEQVFVCRAKYAVESVAPERVTSGVSRHNAVIADQCCWRWCSRGARPYRERAI
jgi:hypothetical protein